MTTRTPAHTRATFTGQDSTPTLSKRTAVSYTTNAPQTLIQFLHQHNYHWLDARSPRELARMVKQGAIAVVYLNGSVLVQGSTPHPLITLLDQVVYEGQEQDDWHRAGLTLLETERAATVEPCAVCQTPTNDVWFGGLHFCDTCWYAPAGSEVTR